MRIKTHQKELSTMLENHRSWEEILLSVNFLHDGPIHCDAI